MMQPAHACALFLCFATVFCRPFFCGPALAQQPPRDTARNPPDGTASISGTVISDESQPRPIRRARVVLNGSGLRPGRTLITTDDGTFVFDRLPAGRYTVGAAKDGYVPMNLGATRPGRPGTAIAIREGESHRVSLPLPRGSVITGTITSADGQPMAGVAVTAMLERFEPARGERRLTPVGMNSPLTDDRGVYRIFGLPPGDYVLAASLRPLPTGELHALTDADIRRALSEAKSPPGASNAEVAQTRRNVTYAPFFFPGTPIASQATPVSVGKGEERTGIDIQLSHVATARVEGVAFSAEPVQGISISLSGPTSDNSSLQRFWPQRRVEADGRFSITGVPPGPYTVNATAWVPPATPGAQPSIFLASTDVVVDGEDISNLMLTLSSGITVSGRVTFDGAESPAVDLGKLRVNLPMALTAVGMSIPVPPVQIEGGGTFVIENLAPGLYRMAGGIQGIRTPVGRWWLKSIVVNGRDVLDRPLELRQSTDNAVVTFSDRASALSGIARDAQGGAAADVWVIAFDANRASWFHNSRRVTGVKTGADGRYSIRNLPPGDYYVVAATDVEQGEWYDPSLLQKLSTRAMWISLGEYEARTQDVVLR